MRTVSIVGARPQFIKLAPVSRAMADTSVTGGPEIDDLIVHTGQHYDHGMSDIFFEELQIPRPSVNLNIGSGRHGAQTAGMLESIESVLANARPDCVVVYGDTNSTLAGALAAAKLHIPIAHVEAGLRSFDRRMPEEVNRIVADHVSDLLLAPTATAIKNLENENLADRSILTGDVMLDAAFFNAEIAEQRSNILSELGIESGAFAVATLHRASNTDLENLINLLTTLNQISTEQIPVVFPVHPRTAAVLEKNGVQWTPAKHLQMIDPVGYVDMLMLLKHARLVLTDSGGLQKEALFVGTPCITLRDETEWPETVSTGGNILAGADPERILKTVAHWLGEDLESTRKRNQERSTPFGDGNAAAAIVKSILAVA